jgi:hypothetical protein
MVRPYSEQESTRLIDDCSLAGHLALPDAMQRLQVELGFGLWLREAHRGA